MRGRRLVPELLDDLPADDPVAVSCRRDLRRLNALMWHRALLDEQLGLSRGAFRPQRVVELGAGDGWLLYQLLERIPASDEERELVLVDRHPSVSDGVVGGFRALGWKVTIEAADVFEWLERSDEGPAFDLCLSNLFLHHFREFEIERLFQGLQGRSRSIAVCEPRRALFGLAAAYGVGLVGCNAVTRHDAVVSVRAGFRGDELTQLWPRHRSWTIQERPLGLFSHYFLAKTIDL